MSTFFELAASGGDPNNGELPEVWEQCFPLLLQAMFPKPGKASGTTLTPRYSVTVFSEGTRLKAVVGARDCSRKFWVTLDGPESVLESIELALKTGKGEWRDSKE